MPRGWDKGQNNLIAWVPNRFRLVTVYKAYLTKDLRFFTRRIVGLKGALCFSSYSDVRCSYFLICRWHLTGWNVCSRTCGNGSHSRLLYCRRQINDFTYEILDDSSCDRDSKPNTPLIHQYNEVPCGAEWKPLPWSEVNWRACDDLMPDDLFTNHNRDCMWSSCKWENWSFQGRILKRQP